MNYEESHFTPKELTQNDFCVGCGLCAGICPTGALTIEDDDKGKPHPQLDESLCVNCGKCVKVCPFVDHNCDEDSLGKEIFGGVPGIEKGEDCGYYLSSYIGHVNDLECRLNSASGGLTSWLLEKLLESGAVDAVCCVSHNPRNREHRFEFRMCESVENIRNAAGSKYYPVEISDVLAHIRDSKGKRFAIVGLPCLLKGLRLAMAHDPSLRERIKFMLGLVCGSMKTKYFTEYLAKRYGSDYEKIDEIRFRGYDEGGLACNYQFEIQSKVNEDEEILGRVGFEKYSRLFGSGFFSVQACRCCDDIFAEMADASFMDAWLPEYMSDWRGTSAVIVRNELINKIFADELHGGKALNIESVPIDKTVETQKNAATWAKRPSLTARLLHWRRRGVSHPKKRIVLAEDARGPNARWRIYFRFQELLNKFSAVLWRREMRLNKTGVSPFTRMVIGAGVFLNRVLRRIL